MQKKVATGIKLSIHSVHFLKEHSFHLENLLCSLLMELKKIDWGNYKIVRSMQLSLNVRTGTILKRNWCQTLKIKLKLLSMATRCSIQRQVASSNLMMFQ